MGLIVGRGNAYNHRKNKKHQVKEINICVVNIVMMNLTLIQKMLL